MVECKILKCYINDGCTYLMQFKEPAKLIFLISNLLILACIPPRIMGDKQTEEAILVFAVPGSWFLLMFFAGYLIQNTRVISAYNIF